MQFVGKEICIHLNSETDQMNNMIKYSVQQIIAIKYVIQYVYSICQTLSLDLRDTKEDKP